MLHKNFRLSKGFSRVVSHKQDLTEGAWNSNRLFYFLRTLIPQK